MQQLNCKLTELISIDTQSLNCVLQCLSNSAFQSMKSVTFIPHNLLKLKTVHFLLVLILREYFIEGKMKKENFALHQNTIEFVKAEWD